MEKHLFIGDIYLNKHCSLCIIIMMYMCISTAYMAHFNAPKFYNELKNNTIGRFNTVVSTSFGISIAIFGVIASLGFLTFGETCSGLILNNYSSKDVLMSLSRVAVAISIVFS
jgi:amino acid permease